MYLADGTNRRNIRGEADRVREPGKTEMAHPLGCAGKRGRFCDLYGGGIYRKALTGGHKVRSYRLV